MIEAPLIRINYKRLPNRLQVFEQHLVHDGGDVLITLAEALPFHPAMRIEGEVVLEGGSDVVWFTFPDVWHDIGRFHRADGTFTGLYANILTPPIINGTEWDTTDLFLDVWVDREGHPVLLDEDELDEALGRELIPPDMAVRAREEARRMMEGAHTGAWPPPVVEEWTLERCRRMLGKARPTS